MDNLNLFGGYPYIDPSIEAAFNECKTEEERKALTEFYLKVMIITLAGTILVCLLLIGIALLIK